MTGTIKLPDCISAGLSRALIGFIYVAMFQIGTLYVSDNFLFEPSFQKRNLIKRCLLIGLWGRINLYKYVSCWLITEGVGTIKTRTLIYAIKSQIILRLHAECVINEFTSVRSFQVCITFGLTHNGVDAEGHVKWDGCANVKLRTFETATQFNHYILSFNINTNQWCAENIYKRLRFLGSKMYSQLITLLFLAVWHGLHSGYYQCFFMEFLIMYFERDVSALDVAITAC